MQAPPIACHTLPRRGMLRMLLGLSTLPAMGHGAPGSKALRVLLPPDPTSQKALLQALRTHYTGLIADTDPNHLDIQHGITPVVALGPAALRRALEFDFKAPLIALATSSQSYRRLLASNTAREVGASTALFAECAPHAQMQLIAGIFERKVTVGVLLSDASSYLERPLRQAATQAGLDLQLARAEMGQDPVRAINGLSGTQVLLAIPDSTLFTPDTLRSVLESTYRRGMPVIGFSAATVTAGTLASAYAEPDDIAADMVDVLENSNQGPLPEARYPRYWRVAINDNVARSLGLSISDKVRAMGVRPAGR